MTLDYFLSCTVESLKLRWPYLIINNADWPTAPDNFSSRLANPKVLSAPQKVQTAQHHVDNQIQKWRSGRIHPTQPLLWPQ